MEDISTLIAIVTSLATIGSIAWGLHTKVILIKKNLNLGQMLTDIVDSAKETAIASDYYIRSTSDGNMTVEEGEEFKNLAATAIISQLNAIEAITGRQIYNSADVPIALPVGGKRASFSQIPSDVTLLTTAPTSNQTATTGA